jgi:HK97 family phage prohead protease
MDLERKQLSFEVKQINREDPNYFTFEGYASTFGNIDLGDDIVAKGAFTESLKENPKVKVLWQHKMDEPIGVPQIMREDEKGLFVVANLPKEDQFVKGRVMPQVKIGSVAEMSIGFFIKDYEMKEIDGRNIRVITKLDLFEFSLVTKAMNPQAQVTNFKSYKETEIKSLKDIEIFLKSGGMSQNGAKTLISNVKQFLNQRDVEERIKKQRDVVNEKLDQILKSHSDRKLDKIINNLNK